MPARALLAALSAEDPAARPTAGSAAVGQWLDMMAGAEHTALGSGSEACLVGAKTRAPSSRTGRGDGEPLGRDHGGASSCADAAEESTTAPSKATAEHASSSGANAPPSLVGPAAAAAARKGGAGRASRTRLSFMRRPAQVAVVDAPKVASDAASSASALIVGFPRASENALDLS